MAKRTVVVIGDREVSVSNPDKVFFPGLGLTKLDLVHWYQRLAGPVLTGVRGRPMGLKRYVDGIEGEPFYQKRAPANRPPWIETAQFRYPSGGVADEVVVRHPADLAWLVNLGCIDFHPHPVRAEDLAHPDELRIDLDPNPGVDWPQVREVAMVVRDVLVDCGLTGFPKTSGSRGLHILVRIQPLWTFTELRRAALTVARLVEQRVPHLATSRWWKEERHGVFIDYNQNAKDRTQCSAYSIRPTPDGRVSTPLRWEEVPTCDPADYTVATVPERVDTLGDPAEGIDEAAGSLETLLRIAEEHRAAGLPDAPAPPAGDRGRVATPAPGKSSGATGRRRSTMPLIEVARAATKAEALAGLDRWKARHPDVWPLLQADDVLVDSMRGRSSLWYRVRLNLRHVPAEMRPPQEALEVDYDPFEQWRNHPDAEAWRAARRGQR
ncbi:MAG: non-homologous end-joining DNA ligase [Micromonosporaceae bacterium]|nr:non-homologous end-joining DNA ligase [Micromonosporaceae bacterium]